MVHLLQIELSNMLFISSQTSVTNNVKYLRLYGQNHSSLFLLKSWTPLWGHREAFVLCASCFGSSNSFAAAIIALYICNNFIKLIKLQKFQELETNQFASEPKPWQHQDLTDTACYVPFSAPRKNIGIWWLQHLPWIRVLLLLLGRQCIW